MDDIFKTKMSMLAVIDGVKFAAHRSVRVSSTHI